MSITRLKSCCTDLSSVIAIALLALLSTLPRVALAGLFTSPFNPTYNVGAEAAWMNPAGMTSLKTYAASAGVGGLIYDADIDVAIAGAGGDDGGDVGVSSVIPSFFAVAPVSDRFRLGLSVYSPLGGPDGFGWDYGDNFAGRYGAQELTFASTAIALSTAFQVTDKFSIGGGVSEQWLEVNEKVAINTFGAGDGQANIDVDDWTTMYFLGARYQLSPATSFGLVYRSKWEPELEGDLEITGLAVPVPTADFNLGITLPQGIEFGIQQALSETWILGLTFVWQDWSQFDKLVVDVAFAGGATSTATAVSKFTDAYLGGLSLTHIMGGGANIIQFEVDYASSPVSDNDRVIALPVDEALSLAFAYAHNTPAATYAIGGALVFNGDAEVNDINQGVQFSGDFDTNMIYVIGGTAEFRF
jgi:long-chain fatty acid transport protein